MSVRRSVSVALVTASCVFAMPSASQAQEDDPWVLYDQNGTTVRATLQFGANVVSEANLFWDLSNFAAPGSGYDPDATWLEMYVTPGLSFETAL